MSGGSITNFAVTGLSNNTSYKFQVRTRNLSGAGTASNQVTARRLQAPVAPTDLRAAAYNASVILT